MFSVCLFCFLLVFFFSNRGDTICTNDIWNTGFVFEHLYTSSFTNTEVCQWHFTGKIQKMRTVFRKGKPTNIAAKIGNVRNFYVTISNFITLVLVEHLDLQASFPHQNVLVLCNELLLGHFLLGGSLLGIRGCYPVREKASAILLPSSFSGDPNAACLIHPHSKSDDSSALCHLSQ